MRITDKILESRVEWLNKVVGIESGDYKTPGYYMLDWAYGGVSLERIANTGSGVHDVFNVGHITKRELYGMINAFIEGIRAARDLAA